MALVEDVGAGGHIRGADARVDRDRATGIRGPGGRRESEHRHGERGEQCDCDKSRQTRREHLHTPPRAKTTHSTGARPYRLARDPSAPADVSSLTTSAPFERFRALSRTGFIALT